MASGGGGGEDVNERKVKVASCMYIHIGLYCLSRF